MPIPNDIQTATEAHLDQYCARLIPEHAYGKVRVGYVVAGMSITLFEQHPHFQDKSTWIRHDVARIRYSKTDSSWTLYCLDRHLKWHVYDPIPPTTDFLTILKEIESDPTGIFWG